MLTENTVTKLREMHLSVMAAVCKEHLEIQVFSPSNFLGVLYLFEFKLL